MTWHTTLPRLMLIVDRGRARGRPAVPLVVEAVRGGVGLVVLREPDTPAAALRDLAEDVRRRLPRGVPLIVNGDPAVAVELDVGLHRRAADPGRGAPWPAGRGGAALLGRSAHDVGEARVALDEDASYVVLGTIFPTASKPGHPGAGLDLVRQVTAAVAPLPIFAIGGMTVTRVPSVVHAGAHGVAVCGAILEANDPRRQAQALRLALDVAASSREPDSR